MQEGARIVDVIPMHVADAIATHVFAEGSPMDRSLGHKDVDHVEGVFLAHACVSNRITKYMPAGRTKNIVPPAGTLFFHDIIRE
ncbi:MAG: hypothetical protein A3I39_02965 [Candidatus Yanofskybacteria bacterium RIFCSPLOWO2_02_FULL_47_9b]|uniref:Uncharacterized protein n=1 Tax=Candidatus Yanofskybacteria bacterium RIFCSPLOWO2_02_FULL_47_9b TaxID=1802708 RepID=A0A1F8HAL9_9BACT|nr:MAG: hypothetical protein A3I39_02965 [Candidatus Yanofskybacteria bacterium RIFCSPLOWO2_02_FULL_47_9b]